MCFADVRVSEEAEDMSQDWRRVSSNSSDSTTVMFIFDAEIRVMKDNQSSE